MLQDIVKTSSGVVMGKLNKGIEMLGDEDVERSTRLFHVSSIGYCLRQTFLKRKQREKPTDLHFLRKVHLGNEVHKLVQKYLGVTGSLFGNWYCPLCKEVIGPCFHKRRLHLCKATDLETFRKYSEITIVNNSIRASGHPDGFMQVRKNKVVMTEIKSISPYYKIGATPDNVDKFVPEHKHQANTYLGLLQEPKTLMLRNSKVDRDGKELLLDMLDTSEYLLMYWDKGGDVITTYPFKFSKKMYEEDKKRIEYFWWCVKNKKVPKASPSKKCKYCVFLNSCKFGLKK